MIYRVLPGWKVKDASGKIRLPGEYAELPEADIKRLLKLRAVCADESDDIEEPEDGEVIGYESGIPPADGSIPGAEEEKSAQSGTAGSARKPKNGRKQ